MISARRPARSAFAFVLLTTTLSVFHAGVASAAAPPLSSSLTGDAKSAYDAGKLLLDERDFSGAATKFRAAYDLSHDARLLWNVAVCEKELHHYARASVLVDRFIHEAASQIDPDQVAQATATETALQSFFSLVTIAVDPPGSDIQIDGESVGTAPLASPVAVDLGKHVVHVQKDMFLPHDEPLEVQGHSPATMSVSLHPMPTTAVLAIHPSEAIDVVAIDNRTVGAGAWQGTLDAGVHRIRVTAEGKQPYILDITLAPNDHRSLDVTLENEKRKTALWPWLVGGGVVVVGAVVAGYFIFKPSDTTEPFPSSRLETVHLRAPSAGGRR